MKKLRWGEHVSRGFSQGSQGISFPILILVSLVCYGNLITDNGKVTLRSTWVSSRVSRDACKTSEIKKVMLLQANIDLGLESTTAAQNYSTTQIKTKSKERTHIFVYLLSATSFGTIFPDFMQTKNSKNIATKLDRTSFLMVPTWHAGNHILKMTTFSRSNIATWKLFWAKCISWMLTNKKVLWFLSFKKCHLVANDFGGIQFF